MKNWKRPGMRMHVWARRLVGEERKGRVEEEGKESISGNLRGYGDVSEAV